MLRRTASYDYDGVPIAVETAWGLRPTLSAILEVLEEFACGASRGLSRSAAAAGSLENDLGLCACQCERVTRRSTPHSTGKINVVAATLRNTLPYDSLGVVTEANATHGAELGLLRIGGQRG